MYPSAPWARSAGHLIRSRRGLAKSARTGVVSYDLIALSVVAVIGTLVVAEALWSADASAGLDGQSVQRAGIHWSAGAALALVVGAAVGYCLRGNQFLGRLAKGRLGSGAQEKPTALPMPLQTQLFTKRQSMLRILEGSLPSMGNHQVLVCHLMTDEVTTISPGLPLSELRERFANKGIRHTLVGDEQGRLLGVISDRDLAQRSGRTARDVMTTDVISVEPESEIAPAITQMLSRRISCLPVVKEGVLYGVLTATDLMLALQCSLRLLSQVSDLVHGETRSVTGEPSQGTVDVSQDEQPAHASTT